METSVIRERIVCVLNQSHHHSCNRRNTGPVKRNWMPMPRFARCLPLRERLGGRRAPYRSNHAIKFTFLYALLCGMLGLFKLLYDPGLSGGFIGGKGHILDKVPLEISDACQHIDPCISIHIFAYQRLNTTAQLLEILASSDYSSYLSPLPLVIHLDTPTRTEDGRSVSTEHLNQYVASFYWPHGPKIVDVRNEHIGLKKSWLNAWTNPRPQDIMIAFEDDIIPSRLYFQWLLKILRDYRLLTQVERDPRLLGISLSPMRLDEIGYPFRKWMTHEKIAKDYTVYLHAVPSSWGAAYFGDQWKEFLSFVEARGTSSFYSVNEEKMNLTGYGWNTRQGDPNLWLPDSKTNTWVASWKRFMVDFAYGRGAYMIYPNVGESAGLATSLFLVGEHIPSSEFINPRLAPLANLTELRLHEKLPIYDKLPLVDMHGQPIERLQLTQRGDAFLRELAALGPKYQTLTDKWRRPCILDTVESIDIQSSSGPRYLVVAPQFGFNNQLTAIVNSFVLAYQLNRTLVLPSILWPRVSETESAINKWVPFQSLFEPDGIESVFPGLKYIYGEPANVREWHPQRIAVLEPPPNVGSLNNVYFRTLQWDQLPQIDLIFLRPEISKKDGPATYLGSCNDDILVLNGLFNCLHCISDPFMSKLWQTIFRPTAVPAEMVGDIVSTIRDKDLERKYACLHLRFGDFSDLCNADPDSWPWLKTNIKNGYKCYITQSDVEMKAFSLPPSIFVISDQPAQASRIFSSLPQSLDVVTSEDVQQRVRLSLPDTHPDPTNELIGAMSAIVEQQVCAQADVIILNAFSTFSKGVIRFKAEGTPTEYW